LPEGSLESIIDKSATIFVPFVRVFCPGITKSMTDIGQQQPTPRRLVRVDMHVHTAWSRDTWADPVRMLRKAERVPGLDYLCITDHNEIGGAIELARIESPVGIIVGEEIQTTHGEITGLFLKEYIPPGLSPREVVDAIHAQGGIVMVPHPLGRIVPSKLESKQLFDLIDRIDILEVYNARNFIAADDRRCEAFAAQMKIAMGAGSDAHFPFELGHAVAELEDFDSPRDFLEKLRRGRPILNVRTIWMIHCVTLPCSNIKRRVRQSLGKPFISPLSKLPDVPDQGFRKPVR